MSARLGVGESTSRQALLRAAKDGWLLSRRTLWQISQPFEQFLNGGEAEISGLRAVRSDAASGDRSRSSMDDLSLHPLLVRVI